jgi:Amt family ammonium transporter
VVVIVGVELLEYLRIDDPIGAWPVHGLCGIWGTLSLGLFATGEFGISGPTGMDTTQVTGLFYGGGATQLKSQIIGSAVMCFAAFFSALALMYVVKLTRTLRVSEAGELEGLDIHEHGTPAYHVEFGYGMTYTSPAGTGSPFGSSIGSRPSEIDTEHETVST